MNGHRGRRAFGGAVVSGPWLRAPLSLLRRPVVLLAVVVSTAVLAIAASSGVLFTSTLGTASLDAQAADDCPELSMPSFNAAVSGGRTPAENAAGAAAMRQAGLSGAYWVDLAAAQIQTVPITLFARVGALAHVQPLTPDHGQPGAWFPDTFAAMLHVHAGDTVTTTTGASLRVAGIYRSLSPDPFHLANLPRYWCTWNDLIVQKITGNTGTPPFLITDPATIDTVVASYTSATTAYGSQWVSMSWYAPLSADATIADATADQQRAANAWGAYLSTSKRALKVDFQTNALLHYRNPKPPGDSPLGKKIAIADQVHDGLAGSVLPIDLAGAVIALLLVAGAGAFWAAHRQREIALLTARGVGPLPLAVKAVLETLPALALGLAAGVLAAVALVRSTGPADVFTPGAIGSATGAASGAAGAGLVIIAIIGALAGRDRTIGARRSRWRRVPVELVLIGFAVWAWARISSGSGIEFDHAIVDVRPLLLLFPLLGVTGVLLLCARLLTFAVPRLASTARRLGSAGFLALRRIGGSRAIAIGLLVGTALPCGLLAYAGTVSTGVHHELIRKYQTNLGAPVVLQLIGVHEDDPRLDGHGTAVARYDNGPTLPDGTQVAVAGVDPGSFGRFAYTSPHQRKQIAGLRDGTANAVLVNASAVASPSEVRLGTTTLHVHVIARGSVFPGLRNGARPLLVVNRAALAHVDPQLDRANEVWTVPSQVDAVDVAIKRDGYRVLGRIDPAIRVGNSGLLPITWIFGYLRALAVLIGAVAIAGLVFALNARTRRRTVAYVMSRRMGLSQGTHLRSLLIELTAIVGLGWVLGTGLGFVGYAVLTGSLDVDPELPPGAAFDLPAVTLGSTAAVVAVVIAAAAAGAHLAAERAQPADILRLE
ncbi:MAG TPA: FtsX-like permease family protein [Jatrophihabitantaceae bacterium]|nr:FtsX-like permease family protein [Jatrophihabitantaceae bacterium]